VIMVFRRAIQKVLCLSPPGRSRPGPLNPRATRLAPNLYMIVSRPPAEASPHAGCAGLRELFLGGSTLPLVCHYMIQPLVELYGGCMVVLKFS
jgi:hypothetical protein